MGMGATPLEALRSFAESLGASASEQELERALPIVTRTLNNVLRSEPLPDLGETEPAFGLRFDVGDLRGGEVVDDGTS